MPVQNLRDLFTHHLMAVYDAETRTLNSMADMSRDATDLRVRQLLDEHRQQTQGQIDRLRKVFDVLHIEPSGGEGCKPVIGLIQEREAFKAKGPSPQMLLMFDLGASAKVEHFEIAAYSELVGLATRLGLDDAKQLLATTLAEEQRTLDRIVGMANQDDILGGTTAQGKAPAAGSRGTTATR